MQIVQGTDCKFSRGSRTGHVRMTRNTIDLMFRHAVQQSTCKRTRHRFRCLVLIQNLKGHPYLPVLYQIQEISKVDSRPRGAGRGLSASAGYVAGVSPSPSQLSCSDSPSRPGWRHISLRGRGRGSKTPGAGVRRALKTRRSVLGTGVWGFPACRCARSTQRRFRGPPSPVWSPPPVPPPPASSEPSRDLTRCLANGCGAPSEQTVISKAPLPDDWNPG